MRMKSQILMPGLGMPTELGMPSRGQGAPVTTARLFSNIQISSAFHSMSDGHISRRRLPVMRNMSTRYSNRIFAMREVSLDCMDEYRSAELSGRLIIGMLVNPIKQA